MNLEYVKSEIYNLGFSDADDVDSSIVIQAINRAVDTIANTVRPVTSQHIIQASGSGCEIFDFKEIAREKNETFVAFNEIYEKTAFGYKPTSKFKVINHSLLQTDKSAEFLVVYKKMYTKITEETVGDYEFELDADLHVLIPLLAAFYVWQDDEERKADKLFNDYETKRNDIVARETSFDNVGIAWVRSGNDGD
jgi:hypothetical protein